jgi:hypothetical protein
MLLLQVFLFLDIATQHSTIVQVGTATSIEVGTQAIIMSTSTFGDGESGTAIIDTLLDNRLRLLISLNTLEVLLITLRVAILSTRI